MLLCDFGFSYWAFIGSLYLLIMTVQDFRGKLKEGSGKRNFFMMGLSISLFSHFPVAWWYILILLGLSFGISFLIGKIKFLGDDPSAFLWLYVGFGIISVSYLVVFLSFTLGILGIYTLLRKLFKSSARVYFYVILLCCFVSMNLLYGFYGG